MYTFKREKRVKYLVREFKKNAKKTNILTFFSETAEAGEEGRRSAVSFEIFSFLTVGGLYSKLRSSLGNFPGVFVDDDVVFIKDDDELSINVDDRRVTLGSDAGAFAYIILLETYCSIVQRFLYFSTP
jgi:hypothetical protein